MDDRLIVALDVPNALAGLELAKTLGDAVSFYKIGLGMLTGGGLALANELKRRGFRFVGPTTIFALMEALGIVDTHVIGSHRRGSSGVWTEGEAGPISTPAVGACTLA